MTSTTVSAGLCLAAWIVLGFALVRLAERKMTLRALPLPWRTATCAIAIGAIAFVLRPVSQAAPCAVTCTALIAASGADYRTGYLFDAITFPTAILVLALTIATHATSTATWGVALLLFPFGAVYLLTRGRMLGLGDLKAMYAVGAAFGPLESLVAIFAASVSGIATVALAGRCRRGTELHFGPHLAAGSAFALIAGAPIAHYLMGS